MKIYNKDGVQIGVQSLNGDNYFFKKDDNLNQPEKLYFGKPPKKKKKVSDG